MSTKPTPGRPLSRTQAARTGPRVPVFAVAVAGLVVVLLTACVVIWLTRDDGGSSSGEATGSSVDQPYGPVTTEGEALPAFGGEDGDAAVGTPAPTLVGETPAGEPITVDPADGPMVIAFVAHWCPHCQAEVPRIVDLVDDQGELDGVKLVAVATGTDPARPQFPPGEWLADEDWPAPVLLDTEKATAAAAYGLGNYPFLVAVDAEGTVVTRTAGEQGEDGLRAVFAAAGEGAPRG